MSLPPPFDRRTLGSVRRKRSAADRDRGSDALFNTSTEAALAAAAEAAGEPDAAAGAAGAGAVAGVGGKGRSVRQRPNPSEVCELASMQQLLKAVDEGCHEALGEVLRDHVWVGMVSAFMCCCMLQSSSEDCRVSMCG